MLFLSSVAIRWHTTFCFFVFLRLEKRPHINDAWCVGERQSDDPNINKGEVNYQGEERLLSFCRSMIVSTRQHHNQRKQWRDKIFWADIAPGQDRNLERSVPSLSCMHWVVWVALNFSDSDFLLWHCGVGPGETWLCCRSFVAYIVNKLNGKR